MNDQFYRLPVPRLSQGDILRDVPSVYARGAPAQGIVQVADAIVLTHACELDNASPRATVTLGLIRRIQDVPEASRPAIREGRNLRLLYLPENDNPALEEGYIDLSRISSVRREVLTDDCRILSATDTLLKAVYLGMIKFVTRFEVDEALIDPLVQRAIDEADAVAD